MKITINQSVTRTETVEKEISVPCFRKEAGSEPNVYCILSENEYIKIFQNLNAIMYRKDCNNMAEVVSEAPLESTQQEFAELFKKSIESYSQAATHFADYIINIDPLPTEETVKP